MIMQKVQVKRKPSVARKGRPTAEESRVRGEQLRREAYSLFLEKGFDATTMEAIAAAAGITKRTLYAKYSNKGELFSAVLRDMKFSWPVEEMNLLAESEISLSKKLNAAAEILMRQVLDPETIKMARMASTKAEQFAEDIQQGFSMSRDPRLHSIVKILYKHEEELSVNCREQIEKTAELFIGMVIGIPGRLAGFGTIREPEFEASRIGLAVEVFVSGICE